MLCLSLTVVACVSVCEITATCSSPLLDFQLPVPPRTTATDERRVRRLTSLAGAAPLGGLALGAHRMATALGAAFTTAVRMVDRVHGRAAHVWAMAQPAVAAGFADHNRVVVRVTDRSDRGPTGRGDAADFAARQIDLRPVGFACRQRGADAGRTAQTS